MPKDCKDGHHRRMVWRCVAPLKVRTCKSGRRLANGKCKRAPLSQEQKHTARVQSKIRRHAKERAKMEKAGALISKIGRGFATRIHTRGLKYLKAAAAVAAPAGPRRGRSATKK